MATVSPSTFILCMMLIALWFMFSSFAKLELKTWLILPADRISPLSCYSSSSAQVPLESLWHEIFYYKGTIPINLDTKFH